MTPRRTAHLVGGVTAYPTTGWVACGPSLAPPDPVTQARPVTLPPLRGDKNQMRQEVRRIIAYALLDCSGSEYMHNGDPAGFRFATMRSIARLMRITGGGRIQVIHWASTAVHFFGPGDISTQFTDIDTALRHDPGPMGGTDFTSALRLAGSLHEHAPTDSQPLFFGITDGLDTITPAMAAAIAVLPPDSVHVLLVPGRNCPDELARQWQQLPLGSFTRLPADNHAMAYTVAGILANAVKGQLTLRPPRALRARTRWRIR